MNAKIKANRLFMAIFVTFSVVYYEIVTATASEKRGDLVRLNDFKNELLVAYEEEEIRRLISLSDEVY